jgi:hypothetical protein
MNSKATRRSPSKTRVLEHELEAARQFVRNDPIGKRFQAAEHVLTLLIKEEFPRVKRFIFNSGFDLREIVNAKQFQKTIYSNPNLTDLIKTSKTAGYIRINLDKDTIQFVLFYERKLNVNEAALFSDTFGRIIASTYASLGIDMSGYQAAVDSGDLKENIKKLGSET